MPEPRPLSSVRATTFDDPPASSDAASPYPDRHMRLRRALRNTNDLARDVPRDGRSGYSPAVDSQRNTSMGLLRRTRRRMRASSEHEDSEDGTPEDQSEGRSTKRRRLDDGSRQPMKKPHQYGHYGQVEPGKLRMEIVSNDGGEHQDPRNPGIFLGADNMLKRDRSVFCSERSSVGIVLRHEDETSFCLEKLHIVGPENGFSAPVREGVVYVAMDIKDLRTYQDPPYYARRSGVHEQPFNRYRGIQASPEQLTLSDALRDPEIATAANRAFSPFPRDELDDPTDEDPYYSHNWLGLGHTGPETHCDIPLHPEETHLTVAPESSIPFTLHSDVESGEEDTSPQEVIEYRHQRLRRMRRTHHDIDDWEPTDPAWSYSRADGTVVHRNDRQGDNHWLMQNGRPAPRLTRARPLEEPAQSSMQRTKAPQPAADDPNVQAARFSIKRGKSRVTVKFDPPVSARYMLLKMWAGRSNVDVQSVIVKGFHGPRFFPSVELM